MLFWPEDILNTNLLAIVKKSSTEDSSSVATLLTKPSNRYRHLRRIFANFRILLGISQEMAAKLYGRMDASHFQIQRCGCTNWDYWLPRRYLGPVAADIARYSFVRQYCDRRHRSFDDDFHSVSFGIQHIPCHVGRNDIVATSTQFSYDTFGFDADG